MNGGDFDAIKRDFIETEPGQVWPTVYSCQVSVFILPYLILRVRDVGDQDFLFFQLIQSPSLNRQWLLYRTAQWTWITWPHLCSVASELGFEHLLLQGIHGTISLIQPQSGVFWNMKVVCIWISKLSEFRKHLIPNSQDWNVHLSLFL